VKMLILSDGRLGHLNQSIALAKHLRLPYQIANVTFAYKFYKFLSYILDFFKVYTPSIFKLDNFINEPFDLIVSAGSSTYYANKTLSKHYDVPSVTMMLPKNYRYDFSTIFAQIHDSPPSQDNIIVLPANVSFVQPQDLFHPAKKSIGIIVGGDNAYFTMNKIQLKKQLDIIFKSYADYEIAITTSPRTPKEIELLIKKYAFAYCVIYSENKINPIADFLHHCEIVFITIDSTSMISEAISYGAASIEILPLGEAKSNKFFTMVKHLEEKNYVHLFDGKVAHSKNKVDFNLLVSKVLK